MRGSIDSSLTNAHDSDSSPNQTVRQTRQFAKPDSSLNQALSQTFSLTLHCLTCLLRRSGWHDTEPRAVLAAPFRP